MSQVSKPAKTKTLAEPGHSPEALDTNDLLILDVLQQDCSLSVAEVAEKVGLSPSPAWRRMDRMIGDGIIQRRVAIVDKRKLGLTAHIFAHVKLKTKSRADIDKFSEAVRELPEVMECYVMLGAMDFMLRIVCKDIEEYEKFFFEKLSQLPCVQETVSMVALSEVKNTTAVPLGHLR